MSKYFILLLFLLTWSACDWLQPETASLPAYIYVQPLELETNPLTQGSASQKITEAWVTVDGILLGAYRLPGLVPVLPRSGTAEIRIEAGIRDNGISTTPAVYPFYAPFEARLNLIPGQTDTLFPKISYRASTRFGFVEDFERGSLIFNDDRDGDPATAMVISQVDPFEGKGLGLIVLNRDHPVVEVATDLRRIISDLPKQGGFVYLELNYRSDVPVIFGLVGRAGGGINEAAFEPGFNAKSEWNKIYFNLTNLATSLPYQDFQVVLRATLLSASGTPVAETARIQLDNIKLVY